MCWVENATLKPTVLPLIYPFEFLLSAKLNFRLELTRLKRACHRTPTDIYLQEFWPPGLLPKRWWSKGLWVNVLWETGRIQLKLIKTMFYLLLIPNKKNFLLVSANGHRKIKRKFNTPMFKFLKTVTKLSMSKFHFLKSCI